MTISLDNLHVVDGTDPNWWRQATVYQIYPRSFADANGDGIGDFKGITSRVPYLLALGVDAVWLSPFYPSALKDGGYDVADYRNIDPRIGTLDDFDELMTELKRVGIKVIIDIVPNHTSDDHPWFQEALRSEKGSNARSRYHFWDGIGPNRDQPPTDWICEFGGPAWDRTPDGQFYLHLFDSSQPDLNWDHPEVQSDFLTTFRFWADRGVSGFRIDVAHGLVKDMKEPLMPKSALDKLWDVLRVNGNEKDSNPLWDREGVHEIYKSWRKVFDEYDPPLTAVAEAWVAPERKQVYASPDGLGQTFSFDLLVCEWDVHRLKETITNSLADSKASKSSTTWVFSNHDVIRHVTRLGVDRPKAYWGAPNFHPFWFKWQRESNETDAELGLRRAKAATLMMLALPGSAYLYQGEELGLPEVVDIPYSARQDPTFFRSEGHMVGRDGCRVPLPWSKTGTSFGFGPDGQTPAHLPQPEWMGNYSVGAQEKVSTSTLNFYRRALHLRRELQGSEELEWVGDVEHGILRFRRPGGWEVILNLSSEECFVPQGGEVLITSAELQGSRIPVDTCVWYKLP